MQHLLALLASHGLTLGRAIIKIGRVTIELVVRVFIAK